MSSADGAPFDIASIGKHRLYAIGRGYHDGDDVLASVSSALLIHPAADRADVAVEPDTVAGTVRSCPAILRRRGDLELGQLRFGAVTYGAPYAVTAAGTVMRCAGAPAPPTGRLPSAQLGGGLITWLDGSRTYAQSARASRRTRLCAPRRVVAHTRRAIVVMTAPRRSYRASFR